MTWFKVDDSFYDHPKVFDAPDCAVALWTRAGSWSARNLTEGFVPSAMPARLCDDPDTAVRELVQRGLWKRTTGGYRFHDWATYQPSKAAVEDLRAKRSAAGRRGGLSRAAKAKSKQVPSNSQASASPVGKQNPTPTRPSVFQTERGGAAPAPLALAAPPDPAAPFADGTPTPAWTPDELAALQAEEQARADEHTRMAQAQLDANRRGAAAARALLATRNGAAGLTTTRQEHT